MTGNNCDTLFCKSLNSNGVFAAVILSAFINSSVFSTLPISGKNAARASSNTIASLTIDLNPPAIPRRTRSMTFAPMIEAVNFPKDIPVLSACVFTPPKSFSSSPYRLVNFLIASSCGLIPLRINRSISPRNDLYSDCIAAVFPRVASIAIAFNLFFSIKVSIFSVLNDS